MIQYAFMVLGRILYMALKQNVIPRMTLKK